MVKKLRRTIVLLSFICFAFCSGCQNTSRPRYDLEASVEKARNLLVQKFPNLEPSATTEIMNTFPKYGYHRIAGDYGDYSFVWKLPGGRVAKVYGRGSISELTDAKVEVTTTTKTH